MTRSSTAGGYASSSSVDTKPSSPPKGLPNNARAGSKRQKKTSVAVVNGFSGDHSSMLADLSPYTEELSFEDQYENFNSPPVVEARSNHDGSIGLSTLKRIFYNNSGLETEPSTVQSNTRSRGIAFRDQQEDNSGNNNLSSQLAELKKTIETLSASNSSLAASHSRLEKKLAAQDSSRVANSRNQQQPEVVNTIPPVPASKRTFSAMQTKREERSISADAMEGHPRTHNAPAPIRREFATSRNQDTAAQTQHDYSDDHSSVTGSSVDSRGRVRKARRADYMERQRRY